MLVFCIGMVLLLGAGCGSSRKSSSQPQTLPGLQKVVVVGFRPAIPEYGRPDAVRSPVTGTTFMAGPVTEEIAQQMTQSLLDRLASERDYQVIPPGQARGVYATLIDSDVGVDIGAVEVFQKVGKAFQADGVVAGYIYRWQEREGGDYAVNRPASVAFDLFIIRPSDGAAIWKTKFDKTQRSLSEDALDFSTFMEGQGRWMQAEKLAMMGLNEMVARMPQSVPGPEPAYPEKRVTEE
jgi:hypothetical protein